MTVPVRAQLEAAVHAYRHHPDPSLLAPLYAAGLDGIARALEVEATCRPGIQLDDATARINGWLRPPTPAAGPDEFTPRAGTGTGLGRSLRQQGAQRERSAPPPREGR